MLLGWLVYRDFPNTTAVAGMVVISASGLLITLHERRRARVLLVEPVTVQ